MTLILSIETATTICSIGLSLDGKSIALKESMEQNVHASRVAVYIEEILRENDYPSSRLDAIAVSMGPGSYTGLRIGVSSAKGLSYALGIPLIAIHTLQGLAASAMDQMGEKQIEQPDILIPMIDARRMEVYSAFYDFELKELREAKAQIIDKDSFSDLDRGSTCYYFGNGAEKCVSLFEERQNMKYLAGINPSAKYLASLAYNKFTGNEFVDTAYFEPFYLKDFIAGPPKVKGLGI